MTHWRLTASGTLPAGDIWVTGLHVTRDAGGSTAGALTAWNTAWTTFWNGGGGLDGYGSLVVATVVVDTLTATEVGDDGKNVTQAILGVSFDGSGTGDSMAQET